MAAKTDSCLTSGADSLARELDALARLLRDRLGREDDAGDAPEGETLALARLCKNLPPDEFRELAKNFDFKQWIAFPVNGNAYPHLLELQRRLEDLSYQTEHDPMTGLFNRRAFERILAQEIDRSRREETYLSLALLDIDHFKSVNDTHGHPCGDEVLKELARVLAENKRSYDLAARVGGEEFAVVFPGAGGHKAKEIMERVLEAFSALCFGCGAAPFSCTFSAGVASLRAGGDSIAESAFYELADKTLYAAKNAGRNQILTAKMRDDRTFPREAMVRSDEKSFLFSGNG